MNNILLDNQLWMKQKHSERDYQPKKIEKKLLKHVHESMKAEDGVKLSKN